MIVWPVGNEIIHVCTGLLSIETDSEAVLKLAGDFVHNYYGLIVGEQFKKVIHLYKEEAVVSFGAGGTLAHGAK